MKTAQVTDLVIDIRYNGGGYLDIASELAYMVAGPGPTAGQTFYNQQFSAKYPSTNPVTGDPLTPTAFHTQTLGLSLTAGQALPTLNLPRVFVLTGPSTCSASEAVMNGLRGVNVQVIQIGTTTCGKPYGFYPQDNCGTTYFSIEFRGVNAQGFGDYPDGFSPSNSVGAANTASIPGVPGRGRLHSRARRSERGAVSGRFGLRRHGVVPGPHLYAGLGEGPAAAIVSYRWHCCQAGPGRSC